MSDQKISNERKRELEQIDPFQEGLIKAIEYIKEYQKQLLMIAGTICLVLVILSSVMYSFKKTEHMASNLAGQAQAKYNKINDPQKGYVDVKNDFATIFTDYSS